MQCCYQLQTYKYLKLKLNYSKKKKLYTNVQLTKILKKKIRLDGAKDQKVIHLFSKNQHFNLVLLIYLPDIVLNCM